MTCKEVADLIEPIAAGEPREAAIETLPAREGVALRDRDAAVRPRADVAPAVSQNPYEFEPRGTLLK